MRKTLFLMALVCRTSLAAAQKAKTADSLYIVTCTARFIVG